MVPMMFYLLDYCGLLLLYIVGLVVCGCSIIFQIYVCKLIGGDAFLIFRVELDLLLFTVVICPTIGGGSLYLCCIVPL